MSENKPEHLVGPLLGDELKPVTFAFLEKDRLAILNLFGKGAKNEAAQNFLTAVENDLGVASTLKSFSTQPSGKTTKELTQLNKKISELLVELEKLHVEAEATLNLCMNMLWNRYILNNSDTKNHNKIPMYLFCSPDIKTPSDQLHSVKSALGIILSSTQKNQTGRPRDVFHKQLIEKIVLHFKNFQGEYPKSTKNGSFEKILRICLESINIHISDLHSRILKAVKV